MIRIAGSAERNAHGAARAVSRASAGAALPLALFALGCDSSSPVLPDDGGDSPFLAGGVELYGYSIAARYPHDPDAFTQGLVLHDDVLFEGTGLRGESSLRRVDLATGTVLQQRELASHLFGEGITVFDDRLLQLTWQAGTGFVYDPDTFTEVGEFSYETEGWGITHDSTWLIMSDGTPNLYFLDPESFEVVSQVVVSDDGMPIANLNELEYVAGYVLANVWKTDRIAVIEPETGQVVSWLDLTGLLTAEERVAADVLNGIAFDADAGRLLVTGKRWPHLFEIDLVAAGG
jgi:glutamine cyclotransferase